MSNSNIKDDNGLAKTPIKGLRIKGLVCYFEGKCHRISIKAGWMFTLVME